MPRRSCTLRSKLTLWYAAAASVLYLPLLAVVLPRRELVRSSMDGELCRSAVALIDALTSRDVARWTSEELGELVPAGRGTVFRALRGEDGRVLAAWNVERSELLPRVPATSPSGPLLATFATLDAEQAGRLFQQERELRVVTMPFRQGEHLYFLQLGDRSSRDLASLGLLLASAVLMVLGVPTVAWLTARRVASPLRALAETARSVSPSNPGERFRVQNADAEFRRLEEELNAALQRMEEGLKALAKFVSNVAHELKSPIAALVTDAQVVKLGRRNQDESRAFVERAEDELKHLANVVEGFLIMARVRYQGRRGDLVYMNDLVRLAERHCLGLAEERRVPLEVSFASEDSPDPFVLGDTQLLLVLVENLLRNAIHRSAPGSPVVLETRSDEQAVRLVVSDRGPAIPAELRDRLLGPGGRVQELDAVPGAAGAGLALVADVVRHHQGSTAVEQNEMGGWRFVVTLPRAQAGTPEHSTKSP